MHSGCSVVLRSAVFLPLLAAASLLVSAPAAAANVLAPATCAHADVQPALQAAASDGGVVQIPAGDCDWGTDRITVTVGNHGLYLRGAGAKRTILRRTGAAHQTYMIIFICNSSSGPVEISDLGFIGDALNAPSNRRASGVSLTKSCRDFIVHDTEFSRFSGSGLEVEGNQARGVVYDSHFHHNHDPASPNNGEGYGVVVYGDNTTERPPLELGTAESVFIEDSCFSTNRHSVASNRNSSYVVRHNDFITTNTTRNTSIIDAHGRPLGGGSAGSRSWEVYRNTLYFDGDGYQANGIGMRGGDGVVFENLIGHRVAGRVIPYSLRLVVEGYSALCPWGGNFPVLDGSAWPLREQSQKVWVWGNEFLDSRGDQQIVSTWVEDAWDCRYYFQEDRDYYRHAPTVAELGHSYAPYTYPHPLRAQADRILMDGFDRSGTGCF